MTNKESFEKLVSDAGIPTSESEITARWRKINEEEGSLIVNDAEISPFWRLINRIVTRPALWLMGFIASDLLPQCYTKTATGEMLKLKAWEVDLEIKEPFNAEGLLTFIRPEVGDPFTVPAGVRVLSIPINGTVYVMITTTEAVFGFNKTTAVARARAELPGEAWNLAAGYYSVLAEPDSLPDITVSNMVDWLLLPGDNGESDDELRLRAKNQFLAVNQFHTDAVYKSLITKFSGIRTDYIYFGDDAPRGPGTADVYILFEADAPVVDFINSINTYIRDQGYHGHGDDMMCLAMPETDYDFTLTVYLNKNVDIVYKPVILADITNMIRCAFRQNTDYDEFVTKVWPHTIFSLSQLTRELHNKFPDIERLVHSGSDITSTMNIPRLNALNLFEGVN